MIREAKKSASEEMKTITPSTFGSMRRIASRPTSGSAPPRPASIATCPAMVTPHLTALDQIRGIGVFEVPEGPPTADRRELREVVRRGRGAGRPLQRPAVPGVRSGPLPPPQAPDQV